MIDVACDACENAVRYLMMMHDALMVMMASANTGPAACSCSMLTAAVCHIAREALLLVESRVLYYFYFSVLLAAMCVLDLYLQGVMRIRCRMCVFP